MAAYADAIITEWDLRRSELTEKVNTVYLGGGTPSLMPASDLARIADALAGGGVDVDALEEFTIEANPEDITQENLDSWRRIGINRVSIGVQSFDSERLRLIGRRHSPEASEAALTLLRDNGINHSADLIYGLPGQTLADFGRDLDRMLAFRPPHMSCYLLSYEPRTRLYAMLEKGVVSEADEELASEMYNLLCRKTAGAGYRHYEISNFAFPGREARHNSSYWNYTEYLGLGCAAHSFTRMRRRANPGNVRMYVEAMGSGSIVADEEAETESERLNDYIITSLRTSSGFSRLFAERMFSNQALQKMDANIANLTKSINQTEILDIKPNGDFLICESMWLKADAILREIIVD